MKRWVMHVDMDAFFASVEQLDHPELKGLPVIVGGASKRGVVSTCSYEARAFGVHSAMPLFQAHKLCPRGIFLQGRIQRYSAVSQQLMQIFEETAPCVEQLSIDEAFLDLSGMEKLGTPEQLARRLQLRIQRELGLSASVGLAPNKFLAKLASDMQKPHGFVMVRQEEAAALLAPLPVRKVYGIGRRAEQKLLEFGLVQVGDLAAAPLEVLAKVFGCNAALVRNLALGLDDRPVLSEESAKSIGKETTFAVDYTTYEELRDVLLELSGQVGWRLRQKGVIGHSVTVKVKYADFQTITRSVTSSSAISWDEDIYALARAILQKVKLRTGVRLLGVTVGSLVQPAAEPELAFAETEKLRRRNLAVDALKKRFGEKIIKRGLVPK